MSNTISRVTGNDEGRGMEMTDSDLIERYNIIDPSNPDQVFDSKAEVRDYVEEYTVNQGFYPGDADDIDAIARRIWSHIAEAQA